MKPFIYNVFLFYICSVYRDFSVNLSGLKNNALRVIHFSWKVFFFKYLWCMRLLQWHWRDIKNLNTFFKIINITVDSTIATVDSTLIQPSIRRLSNRWFDACTTVESTLVQSSIRRFHNCCFDAYGSLCNHRFDAWFQTLCKCSFALAEISDFR